MLRRQGASACPPCPSTHMGSACCACCPKASASSSATLAQRPAARCWVHAAAAAAAAADAAAARGEASPASWCRRAASRAQVAQRRRASSLGTSGSWWQSHTCAGWFAIPRDSGAGKQQAATGRQRREQTKQHPDRHAAGGAAGTRHTSCSSHSKSAGPHDSPRSWSCRGRGRTAVGRHKPKHRIVGESFIR